MKILIIGEDLEMLSTLRSLLRAHGHSASVSTSADTSLAELTSGGALPHNFIIIDYDMEGGIGGPKFIETYSAKFDLFSPMPPIIALTARAEFLAGMISSARFGVLTKPVDEAALLLKVAQLSTV